MLYSLDNKFGPIFDEIQIFFKLKSLH